MNKAEPTLLAHLDQIRTKTFSEGGLTNIIFCGKVKDVDMSEILLCHRKIVEEEVNTSDVNITGLLMGQVLILN